MCFDICKEQNEKVEGYSIVKVIYLNSRDMIFVVLYFEFQLFICVTADVFCACAHLFTIH